MARKSIESMFVSSLINSGDVSAVSALGIGPEHLTGYKEELNWVLEHYKTFGRVPTEERISVAYPGFPLSEEDDPRFPAAEIAKKYARQCVLKAVVEAQDMVERDEVREAVSLLQGLTYPEVTARPTSMIDDPTYFDDYDDPTDVRIPLPWPTPQALTDGIGASELWYWAARPQQGKSMYAVEVATHAALKGWRVLVVSLEMAKRQVQVRMHASFGAALGYGDLIDATAMKRRQFDRDLYRKLYDDIREQVPGKIDIHTMQDGFVAPALISQRAADYELVVIDYVGLMHADSGARGIEDWRSAAMISNGLKEAAMAKETRILAMAQINREGDGNYRRPPELKHLSQTDALGQDGDVVMTHVRFGRAAVVASVEKNRSGESKKKWWSSYFPNRGEFQEVTYDQAQNLRDDFGDLQDETPV